MSITFMYSGQGSQYVGMCKELYETFSIVKNRFTEASQILGYDVSEIMFEEEDKLNNTLYTQPLMFVMYVSITDLLKSKGYESTHTLGLSLGEYGALYDSGVISYQEGLEMLSKRGLFMSEASANTSGKMCAVLGLEESTLHDIMSQASGYVTIANYNTIGQLVISGEEEAVLGVAEAAKAAGAKRAIMLNTSGPFHSNLMKEASLKFEEYIQKITFKQANKAIIVNTTGTYFTENMKQELTDQITSSVKFTQSIETLLADGCTTFIEIGPKKTLSSFVKKINRNATILNVEDLTSLEKTLVKLEE